VSQPNILIFMTDHQRADTVLPEHPAIMPHAARLGAEGVTFATGSDAHDVSHLTQLSALDAVLARLGLDESRLYHPSRGKWARAHPA